MASTGNAFAVNQLGLCIDLQGLQVICGDVLLHHVQHPGNLCQQARHRGNVCVIPIGFDKSYEGIAHFRKIADGGLSQCPHDLA